MTGRLTYQVVFFFVLALASCTGMKDITVSDPLYVGASFSLEGKAEDKADLKAAIQPVIKPAPNHKFLWMRPGLSRYNMLSDSARTRKFWKNLIDAPVLLSEVYPNHVANAIENRIFHNGFFHNTVDVDTIIVSRRKVKYAYTVTLNEPYTIASVLFPKPQNNLSRKIAESKEESLLKPGDRYSLETVKNERTRIDRFLKDNGYVYFSPDFLLCKADTVTGEYQINTEMVVKPQIPPESRNPFTIRNVFVHDDFELNTEPGDTLAFGKYTLISRNKTLEFEALQQGLFLKPGDLYSRSEHLHTIRYFNDLPIIRNSSVKFQPVQDYDSLDVLLYLSQRKRFAYTAEFNTVFRSTNYFGPGVIFSYTDRNANRGAELLKLNLRGSFEMQIVDGKVNPAYELGVGVDYTFPRFFPKFLFNEARKSLPKTTISVGYNLFNRLDLYRLNSIVANLNYSWSRTDRMLHSLKVLESSFTKLPEDSKSQEFEDYLQENPGVRRSFDEQFILGVGYEFIYKRPIGLRNDIFFRGGIDLAGNFLNLVYGLSDAERDTFGRYTLFGVPFSQYIRPRLDFHYGMRINQRSKLVSRFSAGVGIPVGNSDILPYIKQFYVGGTNSLRSFIARSVGPGSEVPPEGYNDVTGDIRLEGNLEYRFDLSGNLKGALFLDAGNVWLYKEDPTRPKGHFQFDTFIQDIAISYGWGLRWDFDFIVARLDFAYTWRTPYLPAGDKWSNGIDFWDPVINIAIGYPF
jgi:outer membrane protein assembly factor BamA